MAAMRGHRPRALVLVRRPGTSGAVAALLTALLGPGCPVPVVTVDEVPVWVGPAGRRVGAHRGRHGRRPRGRRRARGPPRRRGGAVRATRRPGGRGRSRPRAAGRAPRPRAAGARPPARARGRARRRVGPRAASHTAADLDALADQLDAEAERNQPGHEPFMNPAKALALRLDGHTPLLWGTDAAGGRGRRPRRDGAGGPRGRGGQRGRHRPRVPGGRPAPRAGPRRPRARHLPRPVRGRPRRAGCGPAAARAARHRATRSPAR